MPSLVPELAVTDFPASAAFCRRPGWHAVHDRPEQLGEAEVGIDGPPVGRDVGSTLTAGERPFGPGLRPVPVTDPASLPAAVEGGPLPLPVKEKRYRAGVHDKGVRQFTVADPDGCLQRFSESIGLHLHDARPYGPLLHGPRPHAL